MSYYMGKNLDMRVKAFGLQALRQYLTDVSAGKERWVDGVEVTPANPDAIEQLRITIYSLLHDTGLKPLIQVRMAFGQLTLWKKKEQEKAGVRIPKPITQSSAPGDTQPDNYTNLFDDADPLLMSDSVEHK